MSNHRKRWNSVEINNVINLKKSGTNLKQIGAKFNVTANAVSKTLQRYCPDYKHPCSNFVNDTQPVTDSIVHIEGALNWAKQNNMRFKRDVFNQIYFENEIVSYEFALLQINKMRIAMNLPTFNIRFWYK